jgi:hypothetical protein
MRNVIIINIQKQKSFYLIFVALKLGIKRRCVHCCHLMHQVSLFVRMIRQIIQAYNCLPPIVLTYSLRLEIFFLHKLYLKKIST